ncbi:MAG: hypothetical protein JWQ10_4078 [Herbaspirillum sp.]|nr:hypothetical protein [Herbaspirillum sp.]
MWEKSNRPRLEAIERAFKNRGIVADAPGFYDSPAFILAEQADPAFLETYAEYVRSREYDSVYLEAAAEKIRRAAESVSADLAADGRLGLCINASMLLSRILDRMGIWNYVAKMGVAIRFQPEPCPEPQYFYPFDHGVFAAPHAVVVAPPFDVVDVSLKRQAYENGQEAYIPNLIVALGETSNWSVEELFSPIARAEIQAYGDRPLASLRRKRPDLLRTLDRFKPVRVECGSCSINYVTVAFGASIEPLEGLMHINGRSGFEMYDRASAVDNTN